MGIELSSSEVRSRVQLGNAFVFITTIVLQSKPISYNLLLRGDGKQLAFFLLVIIFFVQSTLSPLSHVKKKKTPKFLLPVSRTLFLFSRDCCGFSMDFSIPLLKC